MDLFRDEDLIYEKILREDYRTKSKLDVLFPHSYWPFFPASKSADKLRDHMVDGTDWALREDA